MELRRIRYFVSVADHLSFRASADALHLSQSALSEQIATLERDLDVQLFERTHRRIRLTPAGSEYLDGMRRVVADFETCAVRAREAEAGRRGTLRIGTVGLAMIEHLPRAVRAFRRAYSDVDVIIQVVRDPDPLEALRSRQVDVVISSGYADDDESFVRVPLWSTSRRVVLAADHRLAGNTDIRLRDLENETLIISAPRGGRGGHHASILALCREQNFIPRQVREVAENAELETLLGLVGCGLGFAILAAPFEQMAPPNVTFKPIAGTDQAVHISAYTERNTTSKLVQNFVQAAAGREIPK